MSMSKWKVRAELVKGEQMYQVYRLLNEEDYNWYGNRNVVGMFDSELRALEYAEELNRKDEK